MMASNTFSLGAVVPLFRESIDRVWLGLRALDSAFWTGHGRAQNYLEYFLTELDPMLSQKRMAAEVISVTKETHETVTVVLRPSSRWKGFKSGQYVALDVEIGGVRYRRNYSLSCSPEFFRESGNISLTVKAVQGGTVSNFLNSHLKAHDIVHLGEASGQFVLPSHGEALERGRPVFMAGGSGITPIRSMIDDLLEASPSDDEDRREEVLLIHFAKHHQDIIFQRHFERLAEKHEHFTYIAHFSDVEGFVSASQLDQDCPDLKDRSLYLCGPEGFMSAVQEAALSLSLSEDAIHLESFGGSRASFANIEALEAGTVNFAFAGRQVKSDGQQSLLELAELAGLAPKFGCRGGICHECKCRRPEGRLFHRLTGHPVSEDQAHVQSCVVVPSGNLTLKEW